MDWDRSSKLRAELEFSSLYDELKGAVVAAYETADARIYSFALEHDVDTWDVWDLVRDEASASGDDALTYLADHPLSGGSRLASDLDATVQAVLKLANWAHERWSRRRR